MASSPYVEAASAVESKDHVRLKNHAVEFLLQSGFTLEEIDFEVKYSNDRTYGHTDVHASRDGIEVFVECETNFTKAGCTLSRGGALPFKDGETVFVVGTDGVYLVTREAVDGYTTDPFGKTYATGETYEERAFTRVADLPAIKD